MTMHDPLPDTDLVADGGGPPPPVRRLVVMAAYCEVAT